MAGTSVDGRVNDGRGGEEWRRGEDREERRDRWGERRREEREERREERREGGELECI